jgi:dienelactone hydrolase
MRPLLAILLLVADAAGAQITTWQLSAVDADRDDRPVPLLVVYDAGAPAGGVVIVGHAYLTEPDRYASLAAELAAAGFVAAVPGTELTLLADQRVFAADLRFALAELRAQGADPASPLYGRVGTGAAVLGHSLGGAAALRAATRTDFDVLVTFAILNATAAPVDQLADRVVVPTLMIAALADCVTPPPLHELAVWENLGASDRTGLDLVEGSHCGFAAPDPECLGAEGACAAAPGIMEAQAERVAALVVPWLRSRLSGDAAAGLAFADLVAADPLVRVRGGSVPSNAHGWGDLRARFR